MNWRALVIRPRDELRDSLKWEKVELSESVKNDGALETAATGRLPDAAVRRDHVGFGGRDYAGGDPNP
jgi:hypothetical protein